MNGAEIVHQRQLLDQIIRVEDRERAVADQQVAALRRCTVHIPGHGEHRDPVLGGLDRGDQCPTGTRRLDDDHGRRQAGNDAIAGQ